LIENRHRFDGVVVNGLWQYCGFAAWRALSGNTPYVVFTHGMLDPYFKRAFPVEAHQEMALLGAGGVLGAARMRIACSLPRAEKRLAEQSFWLNRWNAYVVPYGASGPTGDPEVQKRASLLSAPLSGRETIPAFSGAYPSQERMRSADRRLRESCRDRS
jgi:hypothetical protein